MQLFHTNIWQSHKFLENNFIKWCFRCVGISNHWLIYLTQKLHTKNLETHNQMATKSFPNSEYFNDVDFAYSDFSQPITQVINKIAPFMEIRIKTFFHDRFYEEI